VVQITRNRRIAAAAARQMPPVILQIIAACVFHFWGMEPFFLSLAQRQENVIPITRQIIPARESRNRSPRITAPTIKVINAMDKPPFFIVA
jgi:hypothetical protein